MKISKINLLQKEGIKICFVGITVRALLHLPKGKGRTPIGQDVGDL